MSPNDNQKSTKSLFWCQYLNKSYNIIHWLSIPYILTISTKKFFEGSDTMSRAGAVTLWEYWVLEKTRLYDKLYYITYQKRAYGKHKRQKISYKI